MLPAQDAPPPDAGSASQGLGTPVVEIADLEFRYGTQDTPLLRLERLEVAAAERLLIVGPSGCGKSTLMSLLAGVLVANRGRVAILGTDWRALSPSARDRRRGDHVGYLFQQFNLLEPPAASSAMQATGSRRWGSAARAGGNPPAHCPWANSSAWPPHARSSARQSCCLPMSRPRRSTMPGVMNSCRCCCRPASGHRARWCW